MPASGRIAQTWGVNGRVMDVVALGDSVVIAGGFTAVTNVDGQSIPAGGVAVYDATTGRFTNTTFAFDKEVNSIAVVGDVLYAGGKFTKVAGKKSKFLAAVSLTTGLPVPGFSATINKAPNVVRHDSGSLYVGGPFTTVTDATGPHSRPFLARLSAQTGTLDAAFTPSLNDQVHAVVTAPGTVYVGGDFSAVNGSTAFPRLARLSPVTGIPIQAFVAGPTNLNARAPIRAMALSGSSLLVGTTGSGGACALVDASTGSVQWSKHANGDVVAVGVMGSTAYCGGHFSGVGSFDGLERKKVAAVDLPTGTTTGWAPDVNSALGVFSIAVGADALYIGGDFTRVDTIDQQHFGQFRAEDALLAPAAVDSLLALPGDGEVQLSWPSPSTDGGSALLPYRIYRSDGSHVASLVGQTSERTFSDATVTNGTTYTYTVAARSSAGSAPNSPEATVQPSGGSVSAPTAPTGLTATPGVGTALLSWSPPSSTGGDPVTSYTAYRRLASGERTPIAVLPSGARGYTDEDVEIGTRYYYTVAASNSAGEGALSLEASAVPNSGVPSAPVLSLAGNDGSGVLLTWTVPSYSPTPISKYILVRDQVKVTTPSATLNTFTDTTAVSGRTYTYQVRAVNSFGTSKWSNSVVVTIP